MFEQFIKEFIRLIYIIILIPVGLVFVSTYAILLLLKKYNVIIEYCDEILEFLENEEA